MNSLHWRLTLWFAGSLLLVVAALMASAHWHLDYELRQEKWERTHPAQPDWILHGSFTDQEIHDILGELARFWLVVAIPLVGVALASAYFVARRFTRPVQQINQQLGRLDVQTLSERVRIPDADPEIGELVRHFNGLLARLQASFAQLQEYAGEVAHELRTPLQLMRLRIEANAASMNPELAEELQEELARLSTYVEGVLTIARAEQGRLELKPEPVPLKAFLTDVLEPFSRLAAEEQRRLRWSCPADVAVLTDRSVLKQILFNLLANALKHGEDDILLRVRHRPRGVFLLLGNRAVKQSATPARGLGMGLRLVHALARRMPGAGVTARQREFFWVRLQLPTAGNAGTMASAG